MQMRIILPVTIALVIGFLGGFAVQDLLGAEQDMTAKPGKEHEFLKKMYEGKWDAALEANMGGATEKSKGSEHNKVDLGGLWMFGQFKGSFGGMPFEGRSITGYDPAKKKYVGVWVDSMSNYMSPMEGTYDEKTKTMTNWVDAISPMTGQPTKDKHIHRHNEDGSRDFEMYSKMGEEYVKVLSIKYTRQK